MDGERQGKVKRGGRYKSRPHSKKEKRNQNSKWRKKKRKKLHVNQNTTTEEMNNSQNDENANEVIPNAPDKKMPEASGTADEISRGKKMVSLVLKRKQRKETDRPFILTKAPKVIDVTATKAAVTKPLRVRKAHQFKEINRDLLAFAEGGKIGTGTFGSCYLSTYRGEFKAIVKEIRMRDFSRKEIARAREEVLQEATVLSAIGDYIGIPHLFGVSTEKPPFYLVLQYHAIGSRSTTLTEAASNGIIRNVEECAAILKEICNSLMYVHDKGYLHNDLKGNNVVLQGQQRRPVLIDFGKSCLISKAVLREPKLNVDKAIQQYPHIAPEIHRGERQTTASDTYSFGVLIKHVLKAGKFTLRTLEDIAGRCMSSAPAKRPTLEEVHALLAHK